MSGNRLPWKVLLAGLIVAAVLCTLPAGAEVLPTPTIGGQPVTQGEDEVPQIVRPYDVIWVTENPQLYSFTQLRENADQPIVRLVSYANDSAGGTEEQVVEIGPIDDNVPLQASDFGGTFGRYYAVDEGGSFGQPFTVVNATREAEVSGNYTIFIDTGGFAPENITVPVNARVTWVNQDGIPHTITNIEPQTGFDIDSGAIVPDGRFTYIFDVSPGVYTYRSLTGNITGTVTVTGVTPGR